MYICRVVVCGYDVNVYWWTGSDIIHGDGEVDMFIYQLVYSIIQQVLNKTIMDCLISNPIKGY